ncbi:hypothetical protein CK489_02755 [Bradyrhizobium sp. UFLA03-84]|uniref:hypothetical protein n=1 Tax=Bradyrhizobium sp. UFLA03-84 TaxID=418599 RepID=UPI000BAE61D5|nr:hypothetical protein [Bradyrhizobium sp. UFLA03-84]PAY09541.1 hypothetical protein CK489_02755 [Bradyrhizobium sp. UFLA03-84]
MAQEFVPARERHAFLSSDCNFLWRVFAGFEKPTKLHVHSQPFAGEEIATIFGAPAESFGNKVTVVEVLADDTKTTQTSIARARARQAITLILASFPEGRTAEVLVISLTSEQGRRSKNSIFSTEMSTKSADRITPLRDVGFKLLNS